MTVSTTARSQQFTLDGATDAFTFTFRTLVSAPTNIKCIATVGGVDTQLTYTTDYTVAVNSNGVGGTVTLVSPALVGSGTLTVYRETTNTQTSDYDDYNQFPANTLENDLDIRTMVAQENAELSSRAVSLPISAVGVSTELPSPSADQVLGWNSDADALENKTPNTSAYLTKAGESEAQAGTDNAMFMTPLRTRQSLNVVATLTDGATVALDASLGNEFTLSAGGDRTILAPTNPVAGQKIVIRHYASGGARTLTLSSGTLGFRFGTTITALTETASGKTDYIGAIYHATDTIWDVVAYAKGF